MRVYFTGNWIWQRFSRFLNVASFEMELKSSSSWRATGQSCRDGKTRRGLNMNNGFIGVCSQIRLIIILLTACLFISQQVGTSLIHIYHRYKPHATSTPTNTNQPESIIPEQQLQIINSTMMLPQSQAIGEQQMSSSSQVLDNQELGTSTSAIEFSSPMKRIMELISHHHSPLIVVSSSNENPPPATAPPPQIQTQIPSPSSMIQTNPQQIPMIPSQSQDPNKNTATDNSMLSLVQTPLGSTQFQLTNDQRQWTLINPNQMGPSAEVSMRPQILTGQQQQLIQTAVPYEQTYYLNGNDIVNDGGGGSNQQFAVLPAGFPFSGLQQQPSHHHHHQQQQQMAFTTNPQVAAAQQQIASQLQQQVSNLDNSQTQPIFLSSYVPEIPIQAMGGGIGVNKQQVVSNPFGVQQQALLSTPQQSSQTNSVPNSIQQQIHNQSQDESSKSDSNSNADRDRKSNTKATEDPDDIDNLGKSKSNSDSSSGGDADGDDPDNFSTGKRERQELNYDPDEDESAGAKAKRSNNDESEEPSSGSLSYEDKYDSDKDGDRPPSSQQKPESGAESRSGGSIRFRAEPTNSVVANGLVNVGLNDDCMQCICRASSGCDYLLRCITRGADEKYCGPFQLTEDYWTKAGSLGDSSNNFNSFEECANDIDCAAETVTNYMKKYHKDCDGDENITCMDYARLHRLHPNECDNTEKLANHFDSYWAKFQRCAEGYNRTRDGEDEDI